MRLPWRNSSSPSAIQFGWGTMIPAAASGTSVFQHKMQEIYITYRLTSETNSFIIADDRPAVGRRIQFRSRREDAHDSTLFDARDARPVGPAGPDAAMAGRGDRRL